MNNENDGEDYSVWCLQRYKKYKKIYTLTSYFDRTTCTLRHVIIQSDNKSTAE